jgi:hypothetical protein
MRNKITNCDTMSLNFSSIEVFEGKCFVAVFSFPVVRPVSARQLTRRGCPGTAVLLDVLAFCPVLSFHG